MASIVSERFDGLELTVTLGELELPTRDANVDVELIEPDGQRWSATFFTLDNVKTLLSRWARTGECADGTYLWAADLVLVEVLSLEAIKRTNPRLASQRRTSTERSRRWTEPRCSELDRLVGEPDARRRLTALPVIASRQ